MYLHGIPRLAATGAALFLSFTALAALGGCSGEPVVRDRVTGESALPVAATGDLVLPADALGRDLRLRVAYPARGGRYPLVLLSQGSLAGLASYASLADHWAARGYVVIQLEERGDDGQETLRSLEARQRDLEFVLDSTSEIERRVPALKGRIDASRVAVAGHGSGGYTALAAAGLHFSAASQALATSDAARIVAVVLIGDPGELPFLPPEPWRALARPTFVIAGDAGATAARAHAPFHLALADPPASAPHHYLKVRDMEPCLGGLLCPGAVAGPPDNAALAALEDGSVAFLDSYLEHNGAARAWLADTDRMDLANGRGRLSLR